MVKHRPLQDRSAEALSQRLQLLRVFVRCDLSANLLPCSLIGNDAVTSTHYPGASGASDIIQLPPLTRCSAERVMIKYCTVTRHYCSRYDQVPQLVTPVRVMSKYWPHLLFPKPSVSKSMTFRENYYIIPEGRALLCLRWAASWRKLSLSVELKLQMQALIVRIAISVIVSWHCALRCILHEGVLLQCKIVRTFRHTIKGRNGSGLATFLTQSSKSES